MKRSTALEIVSPYRPVPAKENQVGAIEVTTCVWCEFKKRSPLGVRCDSPAMSSEGAEPVWERVSFVKNLREKLDTTSVDVGDEVMSRLTQRELVWCAMYDGECPGYRPSLWTRLVRKIGLRRPVMR